MVLVRTYGRARVQKNFGNVFFLRPERRAEKSCQTLELHNRVKNAA